MSEHPEHHERVQHEHLTFAEAAERLGITANAVRMRVHRGSLASIRVNERTLVLWPQPAQPHERHEERTRSERAPNVHSEELMRRLEDEVTFLRSELAARTAETERLHRLLLDAIHRPLELPAEVVQRPSQTQNTAPLRADVAAEPPEPYRPGSDTLALRWRAWWRRMRGG